MPSKQTKSDLPNCAGVYSSLSSLGAPVTLEELTRLYNGPLADALQFLSQHVVGRHAASSTRASIAIAQEERSKSHLKQPDTARSSGEKAVARLSSAKQASAVYSKQLADSEAKTHATRAQADNLQHKLDHKRKMLLLLRTLETKQSLRIKRLEEMTKLVDELRGTASQHHAQFIGMPTSPNAEAQIRRVSISNTRDSMTDLHSYIIRLSRLVESSSSGNSNAMQQLKEIIAQSSGPDSPLNATLTIERCFSHAHGLAVQHLALPSRSSSICDLKVKRLTNLEKEVSLQRSADLSTALRRLCDCHIQSIVEFAEMVSHPLRRLLHEESRRSKGYVDIARLSIVADALIEPSDKLSFLAQVIRVCRMHGNVGVRTILDEVEHVIRHSYRRVSLWDTSDRLPEPGDVDTVLIGTCRSSMQATHDRATKLLTRKAEKAVIGRSLAREVEELLRESRLVLGLQTKD
ncbi:hypothetical protein B0H15DRAFT_457446 [Mycena belliarum]|uniref:Uncharacterized protein n=1 Tax=Mycena belliarum TaxID=1033014 RepID=A0AAD6UF73_9AGAR|nr:hypothetical protein B0H15DRAFT_457446 [Mycena belliae]